MQTLPVTFLASFLIWIMVFSLPFFWFRRGVLKREHVMHVAISSLLSWAVAAFVKDLFPIPRPFQINGAPPLTLTIPLDPAFPSVHTAVAFALSTSVFMHNRAIGKYYLTAAFVVGITRVIGNVHHLTDILGGVAIGVFTAVFISRFHFSKLIRKLKF